MGELEVILASDGLGGERDARKKDEGGGMKRKLAVSSKQEAVNALGRR